MRGKLRDKRMTTKRDGYERQHPVKRDNRSMMRLSLQEGDDFEFDLEDEELEDEEEEEATNEVPQKK
jgi:hypothetical protein